MSARPMRRVALFAVLGVMALLEAGCAVPAGGYGPAGPAYGGGFDLGADYYQPYGFDGGWGSGYRVGPFRGDEHFARRRGFAHHAFRPASGFHGMPSLPRGGGHFAGGHFGGGGGHGGRGGGGGRR